MMDRHLSLINEAKGCRIPPGTVAEQSFKRGLSHNEPLTNGMIGVLRYACAYKDHYGCPISEDYVLGDPFLMWAKGLRGLLDGMGVVATEEDISTDSKDNGYCETVFWLAMKEAGYSEEEI